MDALEKTVAYFSTVFPAHLASEKMDQTLYLTDAVRVLSSGTDATATYSAAITTMLHVCLCTCHYVSLFLGIAEKE